ncbi:MAG: hypothetical protein ACRBBS_18525, partial [Thalassovita sp.]
HAMFRPDPARPPLGADGQGFVTTAGAASGTMQLADVIADAVTAGGGLDVLDADSTTEAALLPVWIMPQGANAKLRMKSWLDYQN